MAKSVRVLVANRPRLIRELILATIADQPDIEVVGEVQDEADILFTVEEKRPDFLIVALDDSGARPSVCDILLSKFPNMKILALAPERNSSVFYWASLDIHSFNVEASEDGILGALRGGSRRRAQ
jgi:chemotaxis response regulator CheB